MAAFPWRAHERQRRRFLFLGGGLCARLVHPGENGDPERPIRLTRDPDWGGIETWQGGPHYVFNNLVINPRGFKNWIFNQKNPDRIRNDTLQHLLVELDRDRKSIAAYLDGKSMAGERVGAIPVGSLSNPGVFTVGRGFSGIIDFLRVARATLEESDTSIEELYRWQFHGPHLRDFSGRPRDFENGAPGAIEY